MENPFQFGRELVSDTLFSRTGEMEAIRDSMENSGTLFITGPRRYGKTSLLKASADDSARKGNIVLRYDAESFTEIDGIVKRIIEDSASMLRGKVEITSQHIKRYFKSLQAEITFDLEQSRWKASLGRSSTIVKNHIGLLADALDGLEELASEQPLQRRVVLIIDEFQELLLHAGLNAEKDLHSVIQKRKNIAFIFAGSKTRVLNEMTSDPGRPFYQFGKLLFVGEIPRHEFGQFIVDNFGQGGFF
ncbi:MAG: AAA family ATPase, partial [Thermodesulfobacteriota bacterium]